MNRTARPRFSPSVFESRIRRLLLLLALLPATKISPVAAQSSLPGRILWQRELVVGRPPRPDFRDMYQLLQLSPTRLLAVGWVGKTDTTGGPELLFFKPNGDTSSRYFPTLRASTLLFESAVANPDKSFVTFSTSGIDSTGRNGILLTHFDSLGNPGWNRAVEFRDANGLMLGYIDGFPIRLPDGYLFAADYKSNTAGSSTYGCVVKTDLRGNPKWVRWGDLHEWFSIYAQTPIGICPNGSYIVVSTSVAHIAPPRNVWDRDWHLWRILPSGDTLRPTYFGHKRTLERAFGLAATPDNGVIISGDRTVFAAQPLRRPVAYAVKFDSLFRMQWQVRRAPNHPPGGAAFQSIYPLSNGHYMAVGYTAVLNAGSPTDYHYEGLHAEIAPPASPTDTVGVIVGEWLIPMGNTQQILPQPGDSTAYIFGQGQQNVEGRTYFGKITGLVPPLAMPLCARPPQLTQPPTFGLPTGNTVAFALDSVATLAGPRYGEVSLVTWDFGDGTPTQEGWDVRHAFASPTPVRVRVCVTNNLGCQTCADVFPFGPVAVAADAGAPPTVSVFPNPSASGHFTVHTSGTASSARLTVFDAIGRTIWHGPATGAETPVDLSRQPGGVYLLRVVWPDGRAISKKLVK